MKAIIDGDQMIFSCGFATEGEPINHTLHLINKQIKTICSNTGCKEYEVYIKGKGNFRDALDFEYKGHRSTRKPVQYDSIVEFLVDRHGATKVDGIEADDRVSILLYQDFIEHSGDPDKCQLVLSSPDKDLKNTPGWHYNPVREEVFWVNNNQALRHFLYQMLRGDPVDNVKGLPSIPKWYSKHKGLKSNKLGPATAKAIMSETETWEDAAVDVMTCYLLWGYESGLDTTGALLYMEQQGQLLWMIREEELGEPVIFSLDMLPPSTVPMAEKLAKKLVEQESDEA